MMLPLISTLAWPMGMGQSCPKPPRPWRLSIFTGPPFSEVTQISNDHNVGDNSVSCKTSVDLCIYMHRAPAVQALGGSQQVRPDQRLSDSKFVNWFV